MLNVLLSGVYGRIGSCIAELINKSDDMQVELGFDFWSEPLQRNQFLVIDSFECIQWRFDQKCPVDVIMDFSSPQLSIAITKRIAIPYKIPIVIGTQGFTISHRETLQSLAKNVPIFLSTNVLTEEYLDIARYMAIPKVQRLGYGFYTVPKYPTHSNSILLKKNM